MEVAPKIELTKYAWEASAWININKGASYNAPHDHQGTYGLLCSVKVPPGLKGNQGRLEFLDPRNSVMNTAGTIPELHQYFASSVKVKPEPGMVVMFPSFLKHWYIHMSHQRIVYPLR